MRSDFEMVVGLEVHCQLATATKLFCGCSASSFGAPPNSAACPVCTGQPGTLPVLNRRAVELAFTAAMALECELQPRSVFARKNYFYPDLPKGYQISQYEAPFSLSGRLEIPGPPSKVVRLHRIHMEEDAGKLLHAIGSEELDCSLVDFNRTGVPLIEIVSEPDMRSAEEAFQYLTQLKAILQYAGVSRCDMEKGEMRCDANVSVRLRGAAKLGVKVEIKNLNSFRGVRDALEYEYRRQVRAIEDKEPIVQETRQWDAESQKTASMRSKEEAHDYRYFPDPDLVPLDADPAFVAKIRAKLPKLPKEVKKDLAKKYPTLTEYDIGVITSTAKLARYYDMTSDGWTPNHAKVAVNLITTRVLSKKKAEDIDPDSPNCYPPKFIAAIADMIATGMVSSTAGGTIFEETNKTGQDPRQYAQEKGLIQVSDKGQLESWVAEAIAENPKAAQDVRSGKAQAIGSLVGAVMKKSKGKANPGLVNGLLKERLK